MAVPECNVKEASRFLSGCVVVSLPACMTGSAIYCVRSKLVQPASVASTLLYYRQPKVPSPLGDVLVALAIALMLIAIWCAWAGDRAFRRTHSPPKTLWWCFIMAFNLSCALLDSVLSADMCLASTIYFPVPFLYALAELQMAKRTSVFRGFVFCVIVGPLLCRLLSDCITFGASAIPSRWTDIFHLAHTTAFYGLFAWSTIQLILRYCSPFVLTTHDTVTA